MFVFSQHSYFIAPDINGLPTIPESVSMRGKEKEEEIKRNPCILGTSLPLIVFNQIHMSLFEMIASRSCISFSSCGASASNVKVHRQAWLSVDSN